jgi:hypothetical protein
MINRNITLVKQFTTPIETKYVLLSHVHEGSLSHVHEGSLLWLSTSTTCTWRLTSLAWYLYHMYMKAHFSGLVPLPHVHEGSLSHVHEGSPLWLGTSNTCTWRLSSLSWYFYHMYMKALCHMYMKAHCYGLVPLPHVHEGSLLWTGTSITCTWSLTFLAWYLYHMYMKAHFSGLVPLSHVHEGSLLWLSTSTTCTWRLTSLAWYLYHLYMKSHFSGLVPLSHVQEGSLLCLGTFITCRWRLTSLAWYRHFSQW